MTITGRNVLLVGRTFHDAAALGDRLSQWGFRCHFASSKRAAATLLDSHPVDLLLISTQLSDGTGFGLVAALLGKPVTAFLCFPVEDSCLWQPALDRGKECLGLPALRPFEFTSVLEEMALCLATSPWVN
jgi:response regulator RpfG family c-di-GMP phosphodiesterase